MKHTYLRSVLTTALGFGALTASSMASAGVVTANWTGYFTVLDSLGSPLTDVSLSAKTNNQYVTPISGTLSFDDVTGAGVVSLVPFNYYANQTGQPMSFSEFELQAIGDGMGGNGSLVLGNALFNWNGNYNMPVSVVLDAAGFLSGEYAPGGTNSAVPAIDGTYVGSRPGDYEDALGYLALGSLPIVTTAWNTSFGAGCSVGVDQDLSNNDGGGCMGVSPSGVLPLVFDNAADPYYNDITPNAGGSFGGSPMSDGVFKTFSMNFNFSNFSNFSYDPNAYMPARIGYCDVVGEWGSYDTGCCGPSSTCPPPVPVPAAAWLFGSGLLGLIGMARRRCS